MKYEPNRQGATLHFLKLGCRLALGFVWFWEGLVPKVLYPSAIQHEMVRRSGLQPGTPEATLHCLGWAMILAGIAIMSGVKERLAVLVASLSLVVLMILVAVNHPPALTDPFGGWAKDACLFACAAVVWCLAPVESSRPPKSALPA